MYGNTYNTYNMYNAYNTYNMYNTYNTYNTYNMYVCTYVPCMFQYINAPSYQLMTWEHPVFLYCKEYMYMYKGLSIAK